MNIFLIICNALSFIVLVYAIFKWIKLNAEYENFPRDKISITPAIKSVFWIAFFGTFVGITASLLIKSFKIAGTYKLALQLGGLVSIMLLLGWATFKHGKICMRNGEPHPDQNYRPCRWAILGLLAMAFPAMIFRKFEIMLSKIDPVIIQKWTFCPEPLDERYFAWSFFHVIVWVPLAEEVLFRWLLYGSLKQKYGMNHALLLSSFIFALSHFNLFMTPLFFIIGLVLTLTYECSGRSLGACIFVHSIINYTSVYKMFFT